MRLDRFPGGDVGEDSSSAQSHPRRRRGPAAAVPGGVRQDALMRIELLQSEQAATLDVALADVLVDCVADGASVGFLDDLRQGEAQAWWREALSEPNTLTWAAWGDDG